MCSCQRQQVPPVLLAVPVDDTQKMLIFFQTTVYCIQEIIYCNNFVISWRHSVQVRLRVIARLLSCVLLQDKHSHTCLSLPYAKFFFNPLHPNISMHILHTFLHTFLKMLTKRNCLTIKNFLSCQSFPLFS